MEQAERKVSIRSHWLHERSMLFEKYAVNMPSNADRIDLQLEYPACGWIDMHVIVSTVVLIMNKTQQHILLKKALHSMTPLELAIHLMDGLMMKTIELRTLGKLLLAILL